jgi:hypothetical protein
MSGLATLAPAVVVGWKASSAISELKANATAAVAEVSNSVSDVRAEMQQHETWDRTWSLQATTAINACCPRVALAAPPAGR